MCVLCVSIRVLIMTGLALVLTTGLVDTSLIGFKYYTESYPAGGFSLCAQMGALASDGRLVGVCESECFHINCLRKQF